MDFDLTEDQREIKGVARELLAARSPLARVRAAAESREYDAGLWSEIVDLGWPGIAVAEEHGGQGLGAVELAVLLEELGYACAATPFLSTALAAAVIQATGSERAAIALAAGPGQRRADRWAGAARAGSRRGGRRRRGRDRGRGGAPGHRARGRGRRDDRSDPPLRPRPRRR